MSIAAHLTRLLLIAGLALLAWGQQVSVSQSAEDKNYAGAESRFREALQSLPNNPEATFKLAQSLDRLHRVKEARDFYQAYLKLQANGPFAREAQKALQRLPAPK